jgi:hypothetical protein
MFEGDDRAAAGELSIAWSVIAGRGCVTTFTDIHDS